MAVAYRSDTGTLIADAATGAQTISFVTTQPSAGDLVVAGGAIYGGGSTFTPTITDNQGNGTYTNDELKPTTAGAAQSSAVIASKANVASSGTFTMSFNSGNSNSYYAVGAYAFSGAATSSALDVHTNNVSENANLSSLATGTTGATANADSVAVIALAVDDSNNLFSFTATGYTVTITSPNGTLHAVGALAYKILSATGTQSATWTYGASSGSAGDDHSAAIAVYKGAGGGGGGGGTAAFRLSLLGVGL